MQPGIVTRDLDKLTNEELFRVARDRRAADRLQAIGRLGALLALGAQ